MQILYCTDIHGNIGLYDRIFKLAKSAEAIIFGGDLCPHAEPEAQRRFLLEYFIPGCRKSGRKIFFQMGNDDYKANLDVLLDAEDKNMKHIHMRAHSAGSTYIVGYSFVPQMPFLLKDWEKLDTASSVPVTDPEKDIRTAPREDGTIEQDMKKLAKLAAGKKMIYVIHSPPYGTSLDMLYDRTHVGSHSVRSFIESEQPDLTLHGHIHESHDVSGEWKTMLGKTLCINPGSDPHNGITYVIRFDTENPDVVSHEEVRA